jgi:hypothetical protein
MGDLMRKSFNILKANIAVFLIAQAIYAVLNLAVDGGSRGFFSLFRKLIGAAVTMSTCCFYFRSFNRESADLSDMYVLFTYKGEISKMARVFLALWLIDGLSYLITRLFIIVPFVNFIIGLAFAILKMFLGVCVFLFVANPDYPTSYYLKGSVKYIKDNLGEYLLFSIFIALINGLRGFLAAVILGRLSFILMIPVLAFTNLCEAGHVAEKIIPAQWYAGNAIFD